MSLKIKVVVYCESYIEILIFFFNVIINCED